jgi:hypothetical protein
LSQAPIKTWIIIKLEFPGARLNYFGPDKIQTHSFSFSSGCDESTVL